MNLSRIQQTRSDCSLSFQLAGVLSCSLHNHTLTEATTIGYSAISYTWQRIAPIQHIFIGQTRVSTGYNLHSFLVRLKEDRLGAHLWADAICINQNGIPEKEAQVSSMAKIYSRSSQVLVWLGTATYEN
jgi:hypothetical protein